MRILFLFINVAFFAISVVAQPQSYSGGGSFADYQKTFPRPKESFAKKEAMLKMLFQLKGLQWPVRYLYIRSFKYDSQLEVWAKNKMEEPYKLLKIYKVCALAGTLGPKRFEGDYQVPEGFYYIDRFNPSSGYYLSLGLNYPNASDKVLSDPLKPGGDIYIHGGCATVGCIPIQDDQIDELYVLAVSAKSSGQDFIPVHVFPVRYDVKKSYEYLTKWHKGDSTLKAFSNKMEQAFEYFEKKQQVPVVLIKDDGEYVINNAPAIEERFKQVARPKSKHVPIQRKITYIPDAVAKWPEYAGGVTAYEAYLKTLAQEMAAYLPEQITRAFAQVSFIIDADGAPVNFKILKGVDEYFDLELIKKMEQMPKWNPAIYREKPVAKKMVQTIQVGETP